MVVSGMAVADASRRDSTDFGGGVNRTEEDMRSENASTLLLLLDAVRTATNTDRRVDVNFICR